MKTTIVWLRRDLRINDNPALHRACEESESILPIYIYSPEEDHPWEPGGATRWWLHHSLKSLDEQLKQHGLQLLYFKGKAQQILTRLVAATNASQLVFNAVYEPRIYSRDEQIISQLGELLEVERLHSQTLFIPGSVLNNQHEPYRVYTPFYKKTRPLLDMLPAGLPDYTGKLRHKTPPVTVNELNCTLEQLGLLDTHHWHKKLHNHWTPGEPRARNLLNTFIETSLACYETVRDIPAASDTSSLSAYLHFGEISPQYIFSEIQSFVNDPAASTAAKSAEVFIKQLLWREFASHILWHFPSTSEQPMNMKYTDAFWLTDSQLMDSWTRGNTGIPIVDAGMRQLWETGWMHNRVRMIVASLLTKNMGIHWLQGARWFWDTLVDADLANNTMGWQWVSGCGVDAAPYYRIFNPDTQATKFDQGLAYIRRWLPEFDSLEYPPPIIDIKASRKLALERYASMISS